MIHVVFPQHIPDHRVLLSRDCTDFVSLSQNKQGHNLDYISNPRRYRRGSFLLPEEGEYQGVAFDLTTCYFSECPERFHVVVCGCRLLQSHRVQDQGQGAHDLLTKERLTKDVHLS